MGFADIANAIRSKKGTTELIKANDFANEILSIPTGGSTDEWRPNSTWWDIESIIKNDNSGYRKKYIMLLPDSSLNIELNFTATPLPVGFKTSDGASYTGSSLSHVWDEAQDKPCNEGYKTRWVMVYYDNSVDDNTALRFVINSQVLYVVFDTMKILNAGASIAPFSGLPNLQSFTLINNSGFHSSVTNLQQAFQNCYALKKIPDNLNFENITTLTNTFNGCYNLERFSNIKLSTGVSMTGAFNSCYAMRTIESDASGMTGMSLTTFRYCYNLIVAKLKNVGTSLVISDSTRINRDSLLYIINNLQDLTGQTAQTLTLGTTNLAKLTAEEKAIATNKNWILA